MAKQRPQNTDWTVIIHRVRAQHPCTAHVVPLPFQQKIIMDPLAYDEIRSRPSLEERLESIISGAALMADSSCTRDDRRERIVQECNAVRQALQDLLTEYEKNVSALSLLSLTSFVSFRSVGIVVFSH